MNMKKKILFEACVDSFESSIIAEKSGADRIELCADLLEGGTTPSVGTVDLATKKLKIPVMVMIRPRAGDFCYSKNEFEEMKRDIELLKNYNAAGFVFGILKENGTVDKDRMSELIKLSRPLEVTCHRAFDMTRDPIEALEDLIKLGVKRVLTSGQELTAHKGIRTIKKLVKLGGKKIIIMPGSGVDENNAAEIIYKCGVNEIHASARVKVKSKMKFKNLTATMSDNESMKEYELMKTSGMRLRKIREAIDAI
jgi:copper homeostasis protein